MILETDDWRLACYADWKAKKEPYDIPCPGCGGRGQVGGGFKDLDGPRECPQCFGSRRITHPGPSTPKPELPEALVAHMREAWKVFFAQHGHGHGAEKNNPTSSSVPLVDEAWYWVEYESLGKVYKAPAMYRANVDCFYSYEFSGIPARQLKVLRKA